MPGFQIQDKRLRRGYGDDWKYYFLAGVSRAGWIYLQESNGKNRLQPSRSIWNLDVTRSFSLSGYHSGAALFPPSNGVGIGAKDIPIGIAEKFASIVCCRFICGLL
jgi:hypothetical protein